MSCLFRKDHLEAYVWPLYVIFHRNSWNSVLLASWKLSVTFGTSLILTSNGITSVQLLSGYQALRLLGCIPLLQPDAWFTHSSHTSHKLQLHISALLQWCHLLHELFHKLSCYKTRPFTINHWVKKKRWESTNWLTYLVTHCIKGVIFKDEKPIESAVCLSLKTLSILFHIYYNDRESPPNKRNPPLLSLQKLTLLTGSFSINCTKVLLSICWPTFAS